MEELIKTNFLTYTFLVLLTGFFVVSLGIVIFKKTKHVTGGRKNAIRYGVTSVLAVFWIWFFVYTNFCPIALAYYEYTHDCSEEKIGIVDSVEQNGKDRIEITIDGNEYVMVYSSTKSFDMLNGNIDKGDTVKFTYGKHSKFLFEICHMAGTDKQ